MLTVAHRQIYNLFSSLADMKCFFFQAALLNSPRQRRKGQKGTPTMKGRALFSVTKFVLVCHPKQNVHTVLKLKKNSDN